MTLTGKQKTVAVNMISGTMVVCVLSTLGFVIVNILDQPAAATPGVRTVNVQRYEKISLGDDGTVDHFCSGSTGIWYGPNSGDFAVEAGDPLCR